MKTTCFLHIGTEKTGTTSIQNFLSKNRSRLSRQGIIYPRSPGNQNHTALAAYALKKGKPAIGQLPGLSDAVGFPGFRKELRSELDKELLRTDASIIVFSNEHLSSRLLSEPEIERLYDLCAKYAVRTKVIVYLRNQVDYLVSSFGTAIKSGSTKNFPFPLSAQQIRTMDYMALLEPWRKIFGRDNLIVRRFEASEFVAGDLMSDFAAQVPFDTTGFIRPEPRNEALGTRELAFLRAFNSRVPRWIDGKENPARGNLVPPLAHLSGIGPRLTVPPAIGEAITAQFEESNRRVSAEYFGGKWQPLFSAPQLVSDADLDSLLQLTLSDAMDIACTLWSENELRLQEIEENRKSRRARKMNADDSASESNSPDDMEVG